MESCSKIKQHQNNIPSDQRLSLWLERRAAIVEHFSQIHVEIETRIDNGELSDNILYYSGKWKVALFRPIVPGKGWIKVMFIICFPEVAEQPFALSTLGHNQIASIYERDLALTLKQRGWQNINRAHQINKASKTEEVFTSLILFMKKESKMFQFIFENAGTTGYQGKTMWSKRIMIRGQTEGTIHQRRLIYGGNESHFRWSQFFSSWNYGAMCVKQKTSAQRVCAVWENTTLIWSPKLQRTCLLKEGLKKCKKTFTSYTVGIKRHTIKYTYGT